MDWRAFAIASAFFAALTAIFGKIGVSEINSDLATFLRTIVILVVTALLIWARNEWQRPDSLSPKGVVFLILSGVATGLSWLCYYRALQTGPASRVAPPRQAQCHFRDLVRRELSGRAAHLEGGSGRHFGHCGRHAHGLLGRHRRTGSGWKR